MSVCTYDDPIPREITAARVKLLFEKPFFGQMASRLIAVDASKWCNTAATDGKYLYYNRKFIARLSKQQLLFLIGHEVLHNVYDHLGRRGGRDAKIFNMANDFLVNWVLTDQRVGEMPEEGLYDPAYSDDKWSSESLYDHFIKNSTTVRMTLDEHLELGADGDGSGETVDVRIMGRDGPPKLSEEELAKIRTDLISQIIQTVQSLEISDQAGSIPAGIRRMVKELTEPKMDWRALLDAHIRSSYKDDFTFQKPGRRTWGSMDGFIFPSQNYMNTIDIMVAIDTSGSMGEEMLRDILSEVKGIMQTFGDFKLRVITFDTQVYNEQQFTQENIDDIDTYELGGGGGTMFESVYEYMKKEGIEPERLVFFTDGYPGSTWGDDGTYCDVLFVIHGNNTIVSPIGQTAYYEPKE